MQRRHSDSIELMETIDRLPPSVRALVHEYGFSIVFALLQDGVTNLGVMRAQLETWRANRQAEWLATDYITRRTAKSFARPINGHDHGLH